MRRLGRFRKAIAATLAGAAVVVASIPAESLTNVDPRLVAVGQLITVLAVLLGPANETREPVAKDVRLRR